jgi:NAD(P)-dependent dehydrogenase (short-subunit alcohol dehydrogenase family)
VHTGKIDELDQLIEAAYSAFGRVDILVNNAGINPLIGELSELGPDLFQKMFDVNTKGPWYLASRLAPRMAAHGGGSIINVISVGALKPPALQGFYASTKAALGALTKVMAAEWADKRIRVNALAPGSYHSDLFDSAAEIPGYLEGAIAASLQKRIAETDEIVGPVLYLASELSAFTTGHTLVTDGGYMVL